METLRLLEEGKADIGFVQGGVALDADPTQRSTLSSVFYEPVWIFARKALDINRKLAEGEPLGRLTISIGEADSGTNKLARQLLGLRGLNEETATFVELGSADSAAALEDGSIDAAFFVVSPTSQVIQDMLHDSELRAVERPASGRLSQLLPILD